MNKEKVETIENFEIKYKKHPFSKNIKVTLKKEGQICSRFFTEKF